MVKMEGGKGSRKEGKDEDSEKERASEKERRQTGKCFNNAVYSSCTQSANRPNLTKLNPKISFLESISILGG